jgi:hypothetical protein
MPRQTSASVIGSTIVRARSGGLARTFSAGSQAATPIMSAASGQPASTSRPVA